MGGGDDGGYAAAQAESEAKKQQARDALNVLFGAGAGARPDKNNFLIPYVPNGSGGIDLTPGGGDGTDGGGAAVGPGVGAPSLSRLPSSTGPVRANDEVLPWDGTGTPPWGGTGGDETGGGWTPPTTPPAPTGPQPGDVDLAAFNKAMEAWRASRDENKENRQERNQLYREVRDNAFQAGQTELDEDRDQAGRKLKFELFARGLNGGSEDVNQNALLGRTYSEGILDLGAKADAAKAGFRGADETTRLNLLQSIDAGMDMGSALSAATGGMQVAADKATADAQGTSLGNLFDSAGLMYQYGNYAQGQKAGQQAGFNMFPRTPWSPTSGGSGSSGVSSKTY